MSRKSVFVVCCLLAVCIGCTETANEPPPSRPGEGSSDTTVVEDAENEESMMTTPASDESEPQSGGRLGLAVGDTAEVGGKNAITLAEAFRVAPAGNDIEVGPGQVYMIVRLEITNGSDESFPISGSELSIEPGTELDFFAYNQNSDELIQGFPFDYFPGGDSVPGEYELLSGIEIEPGDTASGTIAFVANEDASSPFADEEDSVVVQYMPGGEAEQAKASWEVGPVTDLPYRAEE